MKDGFSIMRGLIRLFALLSGFACALYVVLHGAWGKVECSAVVLLVLWVAYCTR